MALRKRAPQVYLLVFLDWATIVGSFIAAILLRGRSFYGDVTVLDAPPFGVPIYAEYLFLAAYGVIVTIIFQYFNLYRVDVFTTVIDHILRIVKSLLIAVIGIGILSFFIRSRIILDSRLAIMYFTVIAFTLMAGGRVVLFRALYLLMSRSRAFRRRALILGAGETAKDVSVNILMNQKLGLDVIGYLDDEVQVGHPIFGGAKVVGRLSEVAETVKVLGADELLVCVEHLEQTRFFQVLRACLDSGAGVKVSSPLYAVIPERLDIEKYGSVGVVTISQSGPSRTYEAYKRVFDWILAAIGVVLLAPIFAAIALAIKIDSRGPILFTQTRVGRNGRQFNFYKFRSMHVGSDNDPDREKKYASLINGQWRGEDATTPTKIIDSARITTVGAFLRKTSLDELPQLLNVLRGEMSLVGPRPCLPYEWRHYQEWHKQRLSVTPGCTGVWQVFGRSQVGFQDMVILDLFYSQNASFGLDLWLLFKTIPVMLLGRGGK
jgi:exopolysaccharide biosynthesis polyprenyl glycosylphosphotransferase